MSFLLYGAYGYTGTLIARAAAARGLRPVLAGRDAHKLHVLAGELGLPCRAFALRDRPALDDALGTAPLVLHAAGPFARTARPMVEACLRTGTHYLDLTGEIDVFEMLARQHVRARAAGVMMLPGVGFDVVPTDGLAAHLKRRQPGAAYLELAFSGMGGVSRGTARTAVEHVGRGGVVRKGGRLTPVPAAWRTRAVDFGEGPRTVVSIPWGDVATAYHTTGIPNVVVYAHVPRRAIRVLRAGRYVAPLLRTRAAQRLLQHVLGRYVQRRYAEGRPAGPGEEVRRRGRSLVWGQAATAGGRRAISRLRGPESYTLTVRAALAAAQKVLDGTAPPGFQTPARAFGTDFALEIAGVEREDVV